MLCPLGPVRSGTFSSGRKLSSPFDLAGAYWRHRETLAAHRDRLAALRSAVDWPGDLSLYQWGQLTAAVLDFQPDLVIELGRGRGNSTCVFTEAAGVLGPETCRVVSLCRSYDWHVFTKPRLKRLVSNDWFKPLTAVRGDIVGWDFEATLGSSRRCLVFWDAHGFEIAEWVLAELLPPLLKRDHLVIMHDISDARFQPPDSKVYKVKGIWKGSSWSGPRLRLGAFDTAVEQTIAVVDFANRNDLRIRSAEEELRNNYGQDHGRAGVLQTSLGELFSLRADWVWFQMDPSKSWTFPVAIPSRGFSPWSTLVRVARAVPFLRTLRVALLLLLRRREGSLAGLFQNG